MNVTKLRISTFLKVCCCIISFILIAIGNCLLFWCVTESVDWMIASLFFSLTIVIFFIYFLYPIIFKDYINYYWKRKEETKDDKKEEQEASSSS